jgi:hypothetical protein
LDASREKPGASFGTQPACSADEIWTAERRTHDYYRQGTTSLFAALDIATGKVIGK